VSRLKIGLIAPPWFAVPPKGYGGIEWIVSSLAEGLVRRGHEVTLFASGGTVTSAELVSTYAEPPSEKLGDWPIEAAAVFDAYQQRGRFDIIHDHTLLGLLQGSMAAQPVVHTVHGTVTPVVRALYERTTPNINYVAISANQQATVPRPATVIYNGIELSRFPFSAVPGEYLLFVGRISPEKGILDALEIASRAGKHLVILGKVNEPSEHAYFDAHVRPLLQGGAITYLDQPTHEEKVRLYQGALATLFPIRWEEPFGLVMVESMACGTPVIAFRRGSVPEVIRDGITGVICDTVEEAVAAVPTIGRLRRESCREHVADHFSAERMVSNYEALYRGLSRGLALDRVSMLLPGTIPAPFPAS
jgi:glycosyltransferase involved in cell wall biosynthesis